MASLVHALQSFRNGSFSRDALLAEVERILAASRVNEQGLLDTLREEQAREPLPDAVFSALADRIGAAAEQKRQQAIPGRETTTDTPMEMDPDASRTRLAVTPSGNDTPSPRLQHPGLGRSWPPLTDATQMGASDLFAQEQNKGIGDVLNDRFVLEECVGAGGMSTVYKALDRRKLEANDRNPYVAVKVLNLEFRAHPDSLIALQREAKKSQSLAHTNIVRVHDFDRDGGTVYMTMEYLDGKPLAKVLREPNFRGLLQDQAMSILEQVADALMFAHENCIVHSDLKPANIILNKDGRVKVIDFGIARAFRRPDDSDIEATRFDPGSLGALTPTYASPEMLEHREPDPRDDVYALACITYEMLTGRHPFGRMQATEARDGGLQLARRQLSRRQWKALKDALQFDRERRTPSVRAFLIAMRPERALPVHLSMLAKVAGVTGIGLAGYLAVNTGMIDLGTATRSSASDDRGDADSLELARRPVAAPPVAPQDAAGEIDVASLEPEPEAAQVEPEPPSTAARQAMADADTVVVSPAPADPVSLQAVTAVLQDIGCTAVKPSVQDGTVKLQGYVSDSLNVSQLEAGLRALPGARKVITQLATVDEGKCGVIDVFAPYWNPSGKAKEASINVRGDNNVLTEGDALVVDITTPDRQTYVNVDYFSLSGDVVHMLPGPRAPDNLAPANYKATIGDLGEWIIAKPFGTEMVTVIMTPRPLFDTTREEYEKGDAYLTAVRKQLDQISRESGRESVAVDFVMINTRPRSLLQDLLSGT